jgi:hypothetical protein
MKSSGNATVNCLFMSVFFPQDTLSPPSEMETYSDNNTSTSDPTTADQETPVRRSVSFKERANKNEALIEQVNKRRNSDIEVQVGKMIIKMRMKI